MPLGFLLQIRQLDLYLFLYLFYIRLFKLRLPNSFFFNFFPTIDCSDVHTHSAGGLMMHKIQHCCTKSYAAVELSSQWHEGILGYAKFQRKELRSCWRWGRRWLSSAELCSVVWFWLAIAFVGWKGLLWGQVNVLHLIWSCHVIIIRGTQED